MNVPAQNLERLARIRTLLEQRFKPLALEVFDESHRHIGHAGARGGGGHFHLRIVSAEFTALPTLKRHRLIYAALGELMQHDIHALGIEALAPGDDPQRSSQNTKTIENSSSQRIP